MTTINLDGIPSPLDVYGGRDAERDRISYKLFFCYIGRRGYSHSAMDPKKTFNSENQGLRCIPIQEGQGTMSSNYLIGPSGMITVAASASLVAEQAQAWQAFWGIVFAFITLVVFAWSTYKNQKRMDDKFAEVKRHNQAVEKAQKSNKPTHDKILKKE